MSEKSKKIWGGVLAVLVLGAVGFTAFNGDGTLFKGYFGELGELSINEETALDLEPGFEGEPDPENVETPGFDDEYLENDEEDFNVEYSGEDESYLANEYPEGDEEWYEEDPRSMDWEGSVEPELSEGLGVMKDNFEFVPGEPTENESEKENPGAMMNNERSESYCAGLEVKANTAVNNKSADALTLLAQYKKECNSAITCNKIYEVANTMGVIDVEKFVPACKNPELEVILDKSSLNVNLGKDSQVMKFKMGSKTHDIALARFTMAAHSLAGIKFGQSSSDYKVYSVDADASANCPNNITSTNPSSNSVVMTTVEKGAYQSKYVDDLYIMFDFAQKATQIKKGTYRCFQVNTSSLKAEDAAAIKTGAATQLWGSPTRLMDSATNLVVGAPSVYKDATGKVSQNFNGQLFVFGATMPGEPKLTFFDTTWRNGYGAGILGTGIRNIAGSGILSEFVQLKAK